jgi:transcriptional regulator of acetoin/glycerol metabolism
MPPSLHQPFERNSEPAAEAPVVYTPKTYPRNITQKQVREAIKSTNGNLTEAAQILKISRQGLYRLRLKMRSKKR